MTEKRIERAADKSGAFVQRCAIPAKASGPLDGLSFAVKDLIDLSGYRTGCGNPRWLDTHPIAAANAVCVDQLLYAGAHCLGKTVSDELAFGLDGENFFYGTPLNPKVPDRVPGGSSSGSASAVACGVADFALGTDTGGSVRVPACNCGIFGMRPSHGFISVAGVNPLAPTFDTVGILAGSPQVLTSAASVLLGCGVPSRVDVGNLYLLREAFDTVDPEVRAALDEPVAMIRGVFPGRVTEISLRDVDETLARAGLMGWYETYRVIQWAEIWSCLGSWVEHAHPEFGPRPKINFQLSKEMDRGVLVDAIRRRETAYRTMKEFLGPSDLLCMPTTPTPAPKKGALGHDRTKESYFPRTLSLTAVAGIARLPQVSLPLASVHGAPVGLSLLAAHGMDAFLLSAVENLVSHSGPSGP
jgi:amidase